MNYSRGEAKVVKDPLRFSWQPRLQSPSMIVGWSDDAGKLGNKVTDYLDKKLEAREFCEIEPAEFFGMGGVTIEDDLIQFPENKFYTSLKNNLVIFQGSPPNCDWYRFLNLILNVAEHHCNVKELYTIGGMVSLGAHTTPRELMGTFNASELKETLSGYRVSAEFNYETPPGQRPTLNSFLLWAAKKRNIPGASLWVPIPFYLLSRNDPKAQKRVLEFLDRRLDLGLDFNDLNEEITLQSRKIADVRNAFPDINESINKLESSLILTEEENQRLIAVIDKYLQEK